MDWTNAPQTHEAIPVSDSAKPLPPTLSVLYAPDGERLGQSVVLEHDLKLGRVVSDFGGVPFEDGQMSRLHATVRLLGDQVTLEDGGSTNGTVVNGVRVRRQQLEEGDILQIGGTFFGYDRVSAEGLRTIDEADLIGVSPVLGELAQALRSVAPRRTPVLISGEPGAGKRAVARELIRLAQCSSPPVIIQCGAGPRERVEEGLFGGEIGAAMTSHEVGGALKSAMDGTLVLVDVEQLSLHAQAWLYWTLEEASRSGRSSPPRLIATTGLSIAAIEKRIRSGGLRADLFGMLRSWSVEMQPLRRRRQDIPVLVGRCVADFERRAGNVAPRMVVEPSLMWALIDHPWPRNVDELRTVVESACVEAAAKGGALTLSERLQRLIGGRAPGAKPVEATVAAPRSRSELLAVLQEHDYVISRVADHFGKHRQQVYRWMDRFEIDRGGASTAAQEGKSL
ncbi:MAG: sigma-54-dependent Fis family transcriptional regulator [Myxococcota bacterium]